jgi:hypothetical protein
MSHTDAEPLVRFYQVAGTGRPPQRADRSAGGTLPTRAFRYCEAVSSASGFGWLVFPPMDLKVVWDGTEIFWTWDGTQDWHRLGINQFPDFRGHFDAAAPQGLQGYSPPFIGALQEPGLLNLWSGLFARSRPGWSLLLRPPANLPRTGGHETYEGVIEADRWFGPLFVNLRLTRTHLPIEFSRDVPLFQVQPIPREALRDDSLNGFRVEAGLEAFGDAEWEDYRRSIVAPRAAGNCPIGHDATLVRRRRRAEAEAA